MGFQIPRDGHKPPPLPNTTPTNNPPSSKINQTKLKLLLDHGNKEPFISYIWLLFKQWSPLDKTSIKENKETIKNIIEQTWRETLQAGVKEANIYKTREDLKQSFDTRLKTNFESNGMANFLPENSLLKNTILLNLLMAMIFDESEKAEKALHQSKSVAHYEDTLNNVTYATSLQTKPNSLLPPPSITSLNKSNKFTDTHLNQTTCKTLLEHGNTEPFTSFIWKQIKSHYPASQSPAIKDIDIKLTIKYIIEQTWREILQAGVKKANIYQNPQNLKQSFDTRLKTNFESNGMANFLPEKSLLNNPIMLNHLITMIKLEFEEATKRLSLSQEST